MSKLRDQECKRIRIAQTSPTSVSSLIPCVSTNLVATKVSHPNMSQVGHLPHHWPGESHHQGDPVTLLRGMTAFSYTGWGRVCWKLERQKICPPQGGAPSLPNQAFFVFRSPGQGNTWNEICDLTERLLKRFTKYGWCFSCQTEHTALYSRESGSPSVSGAESPRWCSEAERITNLLILPGPNSSSR